MHIGTALQHSLTTYVPVSVYFGKHRRGSSEWVSVHGLASISLQRTLNNLLLLSVGDSLFGTRM